MQFNEKIISLRKSMGLSQEELGAELHVSTSDHFPSGSLLYPDLSSGWSCSATTLPDL